MTTTSTPAVRAHVDKAREAFVGHLVDWLRIPSISGDPAHAEDVRRSAEWLADALRQHGFPTVELWETPGHPTVFAEWPSADPDAPTVVVYGHHDVQPVDPLELWKTPPFQPTVDGDHLRGRGASDDKGQVLFHLLGVQAHLAATGRTSPAVTIKVVVEGEEESGSTNFPDLLRRHRDRLSCDVVVVSDTTMFAADVPSTATAMRGLITTQIDVRGPRTDLHSGSFGGAVHNPLTVLCRALARLHDGDGRVMVPGFYDDVVPLSDVERDLLERLPFDESAWLETATARAAVGEAGYTTLERVWARPTAEVNGIWGGYTGPGHKTIVPSEAHAKLSFRLVADQDPGDISTKVHQWLRDQMPEGVECDVYALEAGVRACATPLDHPALASVRRAISSAYDGADVLVTREGGSGPEADLAEILEAPVVFLGMALDEDRFHAPDESVEISRLLKGAEAAAHLWADLASSLRA